QASAFRSCQIGLYFFSAGGDPTLSVKASGEGFEDMMNGVRQVGRQKRSSSMLGFSLIELLIVVAVILIIAAIAIPNLLQAKMSANESAAAASIHSINTAEIAYSSANPLTGFSALLSDLGPGKGGYIDPQLASGIKSGYSFKYVPDTI